MRHRARRLTESHASPVTRLREVLGLVVRRQLAAWAAPGPWAALVAIALPIGALLSHVTRSWSDANVA